MSKLFISVRITESFFTSEEIKLIRDNLKNFTNKSDFVRQAIKSYLNQEDHSDLNKATEEINKNSKAGIAEIKNLLKQNQKLLIELKNSKIAFENNTTTETYQGEEQEIKTEQVLNLMSQF